jgi:hypothetical protein
VFTAGYTTAAVLGEDTMSESTDELTPEEDSVLMPFTGPEIDTSSLPGKTGMVQQ